TSTVTDTPQLKASTAIYPSFGQMVPAFRMGVQSRLFKSGVLCQITPWQYNPTSVSRLENSTEGDCGDGWYNSHGFVQVSDGTDWSTYVTFPTNPIEYVPTNAEVQRHFEAKTVQNTTNERGQTLGSAAEAESLEDVPDLIAAYGDDGQIGYVYSSALMSVDESTSVPLYASDGTTVIGEFSVNARGAQ